VGTADYPGAAVSPYAGAATRVETLLRDTFAGISTLCTHAADLHRAALAEGRSFTTADLSSLRPTVLAQLSPGLAGTGVIVAPGVLADQPRWLEWWRRPAVAGDPFPLTVDLDTGNIGSYDYPLAPWFDVPCRTGRRVVVGPYVDYAGTDEYILTFAIPITSEAGFLGVAAADIRASDFERALLPTLNSAGPATALVNATGRVLASNNPATIVGSMVHAERGDRQELPPGEDWGDCVGLPWFLVRG
jgi:hypothetical protein